MKYPSNKTAMRCWGCNKDIKPMEGIETGSFSDEAFHEECYRVEALIMNPVIPKSAPDSNFKVGVLLRRCLCGSANAQMQMTGPHPVHGARFWVVCLDCANRSKDANFQAYAAHNWNSMTRPNYAA